MKQEKNKASGLCVCLSSHPGKLGSSKTLTGGFFLFLYQLFNGKKE